MRPFTPADFERFPEFQRVLDADNTRADWCWLAAAGDEVLARAGVLGAEPPAGAPMELYVFGLTLDWEHVVVVDAGRELLRAMLRRIAWPGGPPIDARTNPEVHPDSRQRRALFESAGLVLFQEKQGHYWQAEIGPTPKRSSRLTFRSLAELPRHEFLAVLSGGPVGTLDRNDRYYFELTGAVGWAKVMSEFLGPGDEATWKVGYDGAGGPVGYVMLSEFDEEATGTIAHIGVVPDQRGKGYINDLLAEATADAIDRGFTSILSDTDTLNAPMIAAFERAGHREGVRPWHVWHYRFSAG